MRSIIVGSGPGGVGAALALIGQGHEVLVIDLGTRLEPDRELVRLRLAGGSPVRWDAADVAMISAQPVSLERGTLPQKRSYGSTYPFDDVGQCDDLSVAPGGNHSVVSSAYGGFSNVWGAQVMPFSKATFDRWPFSWTEIESHYEAVLHEIPLVAQDDDYSELFPILGSAQPPPPLAPRTQVVFDRYARHRSALRAQGITVGHARVAFEAKDCTRCGLCMTGCPYGLIYSASQSFDRLRREAKLRYLDGLLVTKVDQQADQAVVHARDRSGQAQQFTADRVFLAAGAIGTTRIMLSSLRHPPDLVTMGEPIQFALPFLSVRPVEDPRVRTEWTLNQFNVLVDASGDGYDLSHVHCYPYNPAVLAGFPAPLRTRWAEPLTRQLLRRVTVGLGYLPSWRSPRVRITHRPGRDGDLPHLTIDTDQNLSQGFFRETLRLLRSAGPKLDLWPIAPAATLSGAAKTYHFGGSFPHARQPDDAKTDLLGRHPQFDRVHLVDGAVFPTVPATTFTLTIMANAHRIATGVLQLSGQT